MTASPSGPLPPARPPLSAVQVRELQAATALLRSGNATGAVGRIRPLLVNGLIHADAYALLASACRAAGQLAEARTALGSAINLDPGNAAFWANMGELLEELGDFDAALVARQRLLDIAPADIRALTAMGELLLRVGDADAAIAPLEAAHAQDRASVRVAHALALGLRMTDQPARAADLLAPFADAPSAPAQTQALFGHLLGDCGNLEQAAMTYRAVLAVHPAHIDTLETLARLLPQIGEGEGACDAYRPALSGNPDDPALWASALGTARSLKRVAELAEWSEEAVRRFGHVPDFRIARADALGMAGDAAAALALVEPLADRHGLASAQAAHWRLVAGDADVAARHALRATELAPDLQTGWAYLGTAWRLTGDARADWLNDYDRLTTRIMLDPPAGYSDLPAFLSDVRDALLSEHSALHHPDDQSARHGTQTRGHLFLRREPRITALSLALHAAIEKWLATLPTDGTHPFLRRNTGRIGFKHSWSIRLADRGFHINHIHQDGWLSSAFYVALPDAVGADGPDGLPQGALTMGAPDASLGLGLAPERVFVPRAGELILFPSYVWHGTVPFESEQPRMTVAFDALPV